MLTACTMPATRRVQRKLFRSMQKSVTCQLRRPSVVPPSYRVPMKPSLSISVHLMKMSVAQDATLTKEYKLSFLSKLDCPFYWVPLIFLYFRIRFQFSYFRSTFCLATAMFIRSVAPCSPTGISIYWIQYSWLVAYTRLRSLSIDLCSSRAPKIHVAGPLTMQPAALDNYSCDACSLICLPVSPPVLVIANRNGNIHHAVVLPRDIATDTGDESDDQDDKRSDIEVFIWCHILVCFVFKRIYNLKNII